jgi:hypothetical protein
MIFQNPLVWADTIAMHAAPSLGWILTRDHAFILVLHSWTDEHDPANWQPHNYEQRPVQLHNRELGTSTIVSGWVVYAC